MAALRWRAAFPRRAAAPGRGTRVRARLRGRRPRGRRRRGGRAGPGRRGRRRTSRTAPRPPRACAAPSAPARSSCAEPPPTHPNRMRGEGSSGGESSGGEGSGGGDGSSARPSLETLGRRVGPLLSLASAAWTAAFRLRERRERGGRERRASRGGEGSGTPFAASQTSSREGNGPRASIPSSPTHPIPGLSAPLPLPPLFPGLPATSQAAACLPLAPLFGCPQPSLSATYPLYDSQP